MKFIFVAKWALFPETKLQIQKYDGLENKERPRPTMEVTLCSNVGMNLGILNHIVFEITRSSSWYMIVF